MPEGLGEILDRLDAIAAYDGPWRPLRETLARLRERVTELRHRADRLDDVLVVALVGGSGVGKSTLLNALAGDQLAETSELRPCTAVPTVYQPPGVTLDFGDWRCVSGSALDHLVIVDTPDSDTIVREHRATVIDVLAQCDVVVVCASGEKYLDEATASLLRPLRGERRLVCLETKAAKETASVRDHWLARLEEQGLEATAYFRVAARTVLDQKLAGRDEADDGFDFPALEDFLRHELTRERIRRIKKANVAGLLAKTVTSLHEKLALNAPALATLEDRLDSCEKNLAQETVTLVRNRLFAEPHLWRFALGREIAARAKGIVLSLFRLLEAVRNAPAQIAGWLPWVAKAGPGQRAAALLAEKDLFKEQGLLDADELGPVYAGTRSELALDVVQAGFDAPARDGFDVFQQTAAESVAGVLRGPARRHVVTYAKAVTGWPAALLADAPPLAFFIFFAYKTIRTFFSTTFSTTLLGATFFVYAAGVLAIILLAELFVLSVLTRALAWAARRSAITALDAAFAGQVAAFRPEREALDGVMTVIEQIEALSRTVLDAE